MYKSYKDGKKVNGISAVNLPALKDEIQRGHIICKGELTQENVDAAYDDIRGAVYSQETDALYFKSVRGEATQQEWLDAVEKVKTDYPTPEVT